MSNIYLERYAFPGKLTEEAPHPELGIIITIPAFNEPDIEKAVLSILSCSAPEAAVEIHVLINHPENASEEIVAVSEKNFIALSELAARHNLPKLKIFPSCLALPAKHAGVGLARKILMDEAVRRFETIGNDNGIIVGFDADSTCSNNYLQEMENFFNRNTSANGCSIYFEHPLVLTEDESKAAYEYELHLRCYIDALRWCGIPHAFQTIGSSMAVNHKAYQRQGGMNRRKAGEDFYFLQRIIREGNYGDLTEASVYPSPRTSERVPFGTGKAINKWLECRQQLTYNVNSYLHLKTLIDNVEQLYPYKEHPVENIYSSLHLSPLMISFLNNHRFPEELIRIGKHSSTPHLFKKHFFQWFDGFKVMKYLHFARESGYDDVPVKAAAVEIKRWLGGFDDGTRGLLEWFRGFDRKNKKYYRISGYSKVNN